MAEAPEALPGAADGEQRGPQACVIGAQPLFLSSHQMYLMNFLFVVAIIDKLICPGLNAKYI